MNVVYKENVFLFQRLAIELSRSQRHEMPSSTVTSPSRSRTSKQQNTQPQQEPKQAEADVESANSGATHTAASSAPATKRQAATTSSAEAEPEATRVTGSGRVARDLCVDIESGHYSDTDTIDVCTATIPTNSYSTKQTLVEVNVLP